jgi:hypothetical protein
MSPRPQVTRRWSSPMARTFGEWMPRFDVANIQGPDEKGGFHCGGFEWRTEHALHACEIEIGDEDDENEDGGKDTSNATAAAAAAAAAAATTAAAAAAASGSGDAFTKTKKTKQKKVVRLLLHSLV